MHAIKRVGTRIEAMAVRYGSPWEHDSYRDFFTPSTNLMLDDWAWPRPIFLEHTVTPEGDAAGVVGEWRTYRKEPGGVALVGELNPRHPMYAQLARDIDAGKYALSSDSASHLVRRRQSANGTKEITQWPLLTASLTKSPAEHRLRPVGFFKSRGVVLPDDDYNSAERRYRRARYDLQFMHIKTMAIIAFYGAQEEKQR